MSMMRNTETTVSTINDHESHLDALLDDLQSSISRTNHNPNVNGNMTGYREVTRTVTDPRGETRTEYHIEYLHPANSTTHVSETSPQNPSGYAHNTVKEIAYKYDANSRADSRAESREVVSDGRLRQNISELDSLLDDLNSQQNTFRERKSEVVTTKTIGVDPVVIDSGSRSGRTMERHYREERMRGRSNSPSARRELVFTGGRSRDPSPAQFSGALQEYSSSSLPMRQQQIYRYEKTTSTRTTGPTITDLNEDGTPRLETTRGFQYPADVAPLEYSPRSPTPSTTTQITHYRSTSPTHPQYNIEKVEKVTKYSTGEKGYDRRDPSPHGYSNKQSYSYSTNSTMSRESRPEIPKTPPPHRSPSPVSFPSPPDPPQPKYGYTPPSPQPQPKFPHPSQQTVTNYKYTTTTTTTSRYPDEHIPQGPRPFPIPPPSPPPGEQQPPKKLEDLMASFSDTEITNQQYLNSMESSTTRKYESRRDGRENVPHAPPPPPQPEKVFEKRTIVERKDESKNLEGPPVYYPPGELFTKKEETVVQRKGASGAKYKEKEMYEYEAREKHKSSETTRKAIVPVCLPLCCGLPCSIM